MKFTYLIIGIFIFFILELFVFSLINKDPYSAEIILGNKYLNGTKYMDTSTNEQQFSYFNQTSNYTSLQNTGKLSDVFKMLFDFDSPFGTENDNNFVTTFMASINWVVFIILVIGLFTIFFHGDSS